MNSACLRTAVWLGCVALGVSAREPAEAVRRDGQRFPATLADVADLWPAAGKPRPPTDRPGSSGPAISGQELLTWGEFLDRDRGMWLVLARGSVLVGELVRLDTEQLVFQTPLFGPLTIPRVNARGVVFRPPANPVQRDQLLGRLADAQRSTDRLWMANGDEFSGSLRSSADGPESAAENGLTQLRLETAAGVPPLVAPLENVLAVGFVSPGGADRDMPQPSLLIGLRDGSRLHASSVSPVEDLPAATLLAATLLDGPRLVAPAPELSAAVTGIQRLGPELRYLSDLPDASYRQIPFLSTGWNYGADRNLLGGQLRVGGRIYPKGVAMHSTSRLAFELGGGDRRLVADLAIDDSAEGRGSVIFRVFVERQVNGAMEWQVVFTSPVVRGGDKPLAISVDISEASRLALVVDFSDRGDEGDHADWLNARLTR